MTKCLLALLTVCSLASPGRAAEPVSPATAPTTLATDTFSVPAPAGYAWRKVRDLPHPTGGKVLIYTATKHDSPNKIVLIVEPETADSDDKRAARIKGDYNGMLTGLHDGGYTDLHGGAPDVKAPVPDRVQFALAGKDKAGKPTAMRGILVFAKQTYHFQIAANTDDEAAALAKVTLALKE